MPRPPVRLQVKLGKAVRRLRMAAGHSQEHFATLVGVHRTSMSKIELGEFNVSLETVERLAKALGISASALLAEAEGEGRRPPRAAESAASSIR